MLDDELTGRLKVGHKLVRTDFRPDKFSSFITFLLKNMFINQ